MLSATSLKEGAFHEVAAELNAEASPRVLVKVKRMIAAM